MVGRVPHGRWQHATWLATLTPNGIGESLFLPGALDRLAFDSFVAQGLVPSFQPGQVVILDNLSVHKSATARRLIEWAGCRLVFLPTSSPDLNPIEQTFSKCKRARRRAAPRTSDAVATAVGAALATVTVGDAAVFFRDAG